MSYFDKTTGLYACGRCGKKSEIVNGCGCDPANRPTCANADGCATDEVIEWAAWIAHTDGTEVCADERSICIAHAILEAVEQHEQNVKGERHE